MSSGGRSSLRSPLPEVAEDYKRAKARLVADWFSESIQIGFSGTSSLSNWIFGLIQAAGRVIR